MKGNNDGFVMRRAFGPYDQAHPGWVTSQILSKELEDCS